MQSLSNKSKVVVKKEMSFMEKIYLPAIIGGMAITISHFFKKKATISYPEVKREFAPVYRGQHTLKRDENGAERCTACGLCALSCPAEAITMVAAERKKGEEKLYREEKYAAVYEINMLRCIFCGLCEEACPKEAIFLTDRLVPTYFERDNFIYGKELLVESTDQRVDITKRQLLPAIFDYALKLAKIAEKAGNKPAKSRLEKINSLSASLDAKLAELNAALASADVECPCETAINYREKVVSGMEAVRAVIDEIEPQVPADIWPVPVYADLLFRV